MKFRAFLILAIAGTLGCGGQSKPVIPHIEAPPGEVLAQPIVIEIRGTASDNLEALRIRPDTQALAEQAITLDPLTQSVQIPAETRRRLEDGESIEGIELRGTQKLSDVGAVVLTDWVYEGTARFGSRRHVLLARKLPDAPSAPAKIDRLDLAPDDPPDRIFDVRPWPDGLRWHLDAEKRLVVETAGGSPLAPGESTQLEPSQTRVDISMAHYAVDPDALPEVEEGGEPVDVDPSLLRVEKSELGSITFRTQLVVRFHGSMSLIVPKEATP